MERYVLNFFNSQYEDPLFEVASFEGMKTFPQLTFYSVVEKERLVEDPCFPDGWVVTTRKNFYRIHEIEKALEEEKIAPSNEEEALQYAVSFITLKFGIYHWVNENRDFKESIPNTYFIKDNFPSVKKKKNTYTISLCFYYPRTTYSEFIYLYQDELVRHKIEIKGFRYKLTESDVITTAINKMELQLNKLIVKHITHKKLLYDLSEYIKKREVYEPSDPSDGRLVNMKTDTLKGPWEKGFREHKKELLPIFKKIIRCKPDFAFDYEYVYEQISGYQVVEEMEYSDINCLLRDIHYDLSKSM